MPHATAHRLTLLPPHRLDIHATDLLVAAGSVLGSVLGSAHTGKNENDARAALEDTWGGPAFLSVRSGLCAFLEASGWEPGSEVLLSALTITDMPKIIRAHGFVPVAVDVDPDTLAPALEDLRRRITPKTRAILVAHLFGSRVDLDPVARIASAHGLMLLEDGAQAFVGPGYRGHPAADVAMFSFGTLKTHTALGGALFTVRDPALRARMAAVQARWPRQSTRAYAKKVLKTALFLLAQHPLVYGLLALAITLRGGTLGDVVRQATRGFPAKDTAELLALLRLRPAPGLLAFLTWRLAHFSSLRLHRRARAGERLMQRLSPLGIVVGDRARHRTHWLFAVRSTEPALLRAALAEVGIDASGASNIAAVGGSQAQALAEDLVFIPAGPKLRKRDVERLVAVLERAHATPADAPDCAAAAE